MEVTKSPAPITTLLDNHRTFLRYLERRVGDRMLAEDILQDAFAKVVARPDQAPADEAIVPWFYRTRGTQRSTSFAAVAQPIVRTKRSHVSSHVRGAWMRELYL